MVASTIHALLNDVSHARETFLLKVLSVLTLWDLSLNLPVFVAPEETQSKDHRITCRKENKMYFCIQT